MYINDLAIDIHVLLVLLLYLFFVIILATIVNTTEQSFTLDFSVKIKFIIINVSL